MNALKFDKDIPGLQWSPSCEEGKAAELIAELAAKSVSEFLEHLAEGGSNDSPDCVLSDGDDVTLLQTFFDGGMSVSISLKAAILAGVDLRKKDEEDDEDEDDILRPWAQKVAARLRAIADDLDRKTK